MSQLNYVERVTLAITAQDSIHLCVKMKNEIPNFHKQNLAACKGTAEDGLTGDSFSGIYYIRRRVRPLTRDLMLQTSHLKLPPHH
jgi:hypothetical protein